MSDPASNGSHILFHDDSIHCILNLKESYSGLRFNNLLPSKYAKYIIGGIVIGLLIQTPIRDSGKFTRKITEKIAAGSIWNGIGIQAQKKPIATPPHKDLLENCHSFL